MAENEAAILAAAKKLPFEDRLAHKTWKVRSELFEDVKSACSKAFNGDDPILNQAAPLFAKGMADANLNVQDTAVEALCSWLQKAEVPQASRISTAACQAIASKVLKARPFTVAKAAEACYLLIELEQQETVVESMLKAAGDKVPKVAAAALDIVKNAVALFGARVVDAKLVIKGLPLVFGSANAGIRDKAKEIAIELAAYLGGAAVTGSLLEKMPAAMRKDVETAIAALPPGRKQAERWTRKEQAERAAAVGGPDAMDIDGEFEGETLQNGNSITEVEMEDADADPYDFATPVDVISPLNKEMLTIGDDKVAFWDCFESKKWNVRKAALDHFKAAAKGPRLDESSDYTPIVRELKKILAKDANITCAVAAAECAGLLASGLRSNFIPMAKSLCPAILERLKEKNVMMSRAAEESLRTLATYCYSIVDVADDLNAAMQHKNPKVRLETAKLVGFMAEGASKPVALRALKDTPVAVTLGTLASDADAGVRDAAMAGLASFAARAGSLGAIEKVLEKLDDVKRKKVEDLVRSLAAKQGAAKGNKVGAASSTGSASRPTPPKKAASLAPGGAVPPPQRSGSGVAKEPKRTAASSKPSSSSPGSNDTIRATGRATAKRPTATSARAVGSSGGAELAAAPRLSADEALAHIQDLFGTEVFEGLQSAKWHERLEAMTKIEEWITTRIDSAQDTFSSVDSGTIAQCLGVLPGWSKEKNFQVVNKAFEIVGVLASLGPGLAKADAAMAIAPLAERIAELKHRLPAAAALTAVGESVTPGFVASELRKAATSAKNPKVPAETLAWTATALVEFGLGPGKFDVPGLLEWAREALGSAAAPVRARGIDLLGTLHAVLGPAISAQATAGLKPAQVSQVEDAFTKNPQGSAPEPVKFVKTKKKTSTSISTSGETTSDAQGQETENDDDDVTDLDGLLPRADLSGAITPSLLDLLGSANWKERSAGLDGVEEALQAAGNRIAPDLGPDLLPALRARLADTNRNLATRSLGLIGRLAAAVGPRGDWERSAQRAQLLPAVVACLSDNKRQVRDAVLGALREWLAVGGPELRAIAAAADVVAAPKTIADGKVAAVQWMTSSVANLPDNKAGPAAADAVARAVVAASRDKSGAVREAGSGLLTAAVAALGVSAISAGASSGDEKTLRDLLSKAGVSSAPSGADQGNRAGPKPTAGLKTTAVSKAAAQSSSAATSANQARTPGARTASLRAAMASAPAAPPEELLVANVQARADRARRFRVRSMRYEGLPEEEAELLERELASVTSSDLRSELFSADFRSQLRGVDLLTAELAREGGWEGLAANLDLLFRWVVLRLAEGNSQVVTRVLDLALGLLQGLQVHSGSSPYLADVEALALLPAVVEKSGHPQERIRAQHRAVLRAAVPVYPMPKLLEVLTPGLSSKSARTRGEIADFVATTLLQEQPDAALPALIACRARPLPAVGALLRDRDASTRSAAMSAVEVAVTVGGDDVLRHFGKLEPREQEMVEERLRRSKGSSGRLGMAETSNSSYYATADGSAATYGSSLQTPDESHLYQPGLDAVVAVPPPQFTPPAALQATPPSYNDGEALYQSGTGNNNQGINHQGQPISHDETITSSHSSYTTPLQQQQPPRDDPGFEARWEAQVAALASADRDGVVEAMKAVCSELMPAAEGSVNVRGVAIMARSAEVLFTRVHGVLVDIFSRAAAADDRTLPVPARGCKYGLNVMLQGLAVPEIAQSLSQKSLRECVSLLLLRLLDDRGLLRFEEGHTLVKAVNVLMLKMLETSNRTYCFGALLQLLRSPPEDPVLKAKGRSSSLVAKFHDLVVKCLIKLTKSLQSDVTSVDVRALLLDIHDFFLFLGVDEIRRRSGAEDKPLRMVKTILHELCKLQGYGIYTYADAIPGRNAQPQPIIFAYISLNLSTLSASGVIESAESSSSPSVASSVSSQQSVSNNVNVAMTEEDKAAVKAGLKEIMPRLMHRSEADAAMAQLYDLRRRFPAYVDKYIAGTSDMFRAYIRDGLEKLKAKEASGGIAVEAPTTSINHSAANATTSNERPLPPQLAIPPSPTPAPEGHTSLETTPSSGSLVRLSSLRERLANARYTLEGGNVPPKPLISPVRGRPTGDLSSVRSAIDDLAERMATLRRASHTSG